MSRLIKIYKRNIYGIMGTLVFHILLVLSFLLADINIKGDVREEEMIIEFPDILPEPEDAVEEETQKQEESTDAPSSQNVESRSKITNIASNKLSSDKEFFNKDYLNEVEAAKQLASDVNKQLSKEKVNLDDIKMPVETTEGMNPDSIKNIIYTGESNIVYYLKNRYHVSLPIPVYLAQGGGKVIVDIVVNRRGLVISASARKNPDILDQQIFLYAQMAAAKTIFNADEKAPAKQKGSIHYTFMAQ